MIWQSQEFDLTVEEAEEYAAQVGSLITISEVYGGLPSGGNTGEILIKNSNEDYDVIWSDIDSKLPDVNSTDYGKVLTVSNDGIWNAQQPIFMVIITNKNNVFSANKTFSEITNAAEHNMMVVATYAGAYYQYCGTGGGTAVRQFVHIFTRDKVQTIKLFSVNISNVWTQYQYQLGTYNKPDSGIPASDLAADVHLIPAGGSEGYVLKKNSSNDYDVIWTEDNTTEIEYFDFTWDGDHNPVPATGVTGEAIFNAITNGKLVFVRVTVNSSSYPYIFSLQAHYSNTYLDFVSTNGPIIYVLNYSTFFGQGSWSMFEYTIPDASTDTPQSLGVAAVGSSGAFARADHVHAMPSAADIGAYAKPSGGIPKTDLTAAVQTSLNKADTALQEHQDVSGKLDKTGGTMSGILNMGSQKITNLAAGVNAQDAVNLQQVQTMVEEGAATYRGNFSNKNNLISQSWQSTDPAAPYYVDTNDFAIVTADETHNNECWRYVYSESIGWDAEYKINDSPMSQAQLDALNSGITAAKVIEFEGKYNKPNSGIPSSDLSSSVQTSLGKAYTALQLENVDNSFSTTSENPVQNKVIKAALDGKGTYSKPSGGIPKTDMAEDVQTSLGKADTALQNVKIPKGELNGTSTSTVMTATIDGVTALYDGLPIWLKNGVETSAAGVTLNINNLGAKPIYASQSAATAITTQFNVNYTALLIYNSTRVTGGCWDYVYGYETNTTYTPVKLGFGYATCSTAEATAAKTAALSSYTLTTGGIVVVKFTNAVPANATLNINSKGAKAIYYKGAAITAGVIKAGDTVTMIYSTYYHVLSIDRDVDTLPPSPSDNNPEYVNTTPSPGTSLAYARDDHVHALSGSTLESILDEDVAAHIDMLIIFGTVTDGATVVLRASQPGAGYLGYEILGGRKHVVYFLVPLVSDPQEMTDFRVISAATTSKAEITANGLELQFNGIADGKLYSTEIELPFNSDNAVGTLSVTDLALPSAQGVSF